MNIYITSATPFEVQPLKELVSKSDLKNIHFHVSGVGILQSVFSIHKLITEQSPDFILQAGIAGTFDEQCILGDVVLVKEEFSGTSGVAENNEWKDIFDLNLAQKDLHPFTGKSLINPWLKDYKQLSLKEIRAVTVDEISTDKNRIAQLKQKYNPYIESMEGAALHYCALQYYIPFLQIRGISNFVGDRNKQNWKIKEAIQNVCEKTFALLENMAGKKP